MCYLILRVVQMPEQRLQQQPATQNRQREIFDFVERDNSGKTHALTRTPCVRNGENLTETIQNNQKNTPQK